MKGRAPNAAEKRYMSAVCDLGCIVCWWHYDQYTPAGLHHCDGRTKPGAHYNILPLCTKHHQHGEQEGTFISIHPWKKRFQDAYGTQEDLRRLVNQRLPEHARRKT